MQILSFDVGGTKISSALVDEKGNLLTTVETVATPKTASEIVDVFSTTTQKYTYDGVAIATAGVVFNNQIVGKPNNLPEGYQHIDFGSIIKTPILIENDANAAAWGEYKVGSLKNVKHGVMLTLGTGVGCGIISNGHLLYGKCGAAGEVYFACSGKDMIQFARENNVESSDCFEIQTMAEKGIVGAQTTLAKWTHNLEESLVVINYLLDTEIIALSGTLAKIVDYEKLEKAVNTQTPRNPVLVKPAICGSDAGLVGAAMLLCAKMGK